MNNHSGRPRWMLFFICLFVWIWVCAAAVPGRWEKVAQLSKGIQIILFLKDGQRLEGFFGELLPDVLLLTTEKGELRIQRSNITEIQAQLPPSALKRRASLVGLGFGAVTGALIGAGRYPSDESGWGNATIPLYILIGAGAGFVTGRVFQSGDAEYQTIYSAP
jgi:hypothetical protein